MTAIQSPSEFGITRRVLSNPPWQPLSEEQFKELSSARNALVLLISYEENLESVIESLIELESSVLEIAIRHSVQLRMHDHEQFSHERLLINRRVTSLLAIARQYLDQKGSILKSLLSEQCEHAQHLDQHYSVEYDKLFGYRVCEALRNYALHAGHPVTNMIYESSWEDLDIGKRMKGGLTPQLQLHELMRAKTLNERLRAELQEKYAAGTKALSLMPLVREYIAGIGHAHEACRGSLKEHTRAWDRLINDAVQCYEATEGAVNPGICIVERDTTTREWRRYEYIGKRLSAARQDCERKNAHFQNLPLRYVASR